MSESKTKQTPGTKAKTPRPYLSWSQFQAYETSPANYAFRYIYEGNPDNAYMKLGKAVHEMIEDDAEQEDVDLEHLRTFLPQYPKKEYEIRAKLSKDLEILGKPDGFDPKKLHIGEYKTGKAWTQQTADKHDQLTFYALLVFLKYGKMPKKIIVHWMPTILHPTEGLKLTGDIKHFETQRSVEDIIKIGVRAKKAWRGIQELCEEEYKSIGLL